MQKGNILIIVVIFIIMALVGFFVQNNNKQSSRIVKVGYLNHIGGAPWAVADVQKFFQKENIKVEGIGFDSSNLIFDAIVRGDIDMSPSVSIIAVLANHIKDPGKIKVFSANAQSKDNPIDSFFVKNESQIKSVSDLAEKKIGLTPGGTPTTYLQEYLKQQNIDISKIEFVQIPPQNQIQALESGSIDALYAFEPNCTTILNNGGSRIIVNGIIPGFLDNTPTGLGAISQKFIDEDPDLADKSIKAFGEAFNFVDTRTEETRNIISSFFKMDTAITNKIALEKFYLIDDSVKNRITEFTKLLVNWKVLESTPDLSTIFYK